MVNRSDWDLDLTYGQGGETLAAEVLTRGKTVEVKRDRKWKKTGNVYVETACWSWREECWYESGITTSKAAYYTFVLGEALLSVPTEMLRACVAKYGTPRECKIPPNPSKGYTVTPQHIFDIVQAAANE